MSTTAVVAEADAAGVVPGLLVCFPAGKDFFLGFISCEYELPHPIVRKNDIKTILNKFVCKGLNTIFVKLWLVF
ncbi:hypothetical protein GCM10022423_37180 [Flavobacterium ginsengiterrae]|uniref:Uncharacterized protein n=1 Tax=Flavobacterium ginsengiterrae TaxID=871695 RepID=A0ABP7GZS8_9FLAO